MDLRSRVSAIMARRLPLFDAHCHLQDSRIMQHTETVLAAAERAGVQRMAVNGCCEEDWQKVSSDL